MPITSSYTVTIELARAGGNTAYAAGGPGPHFLGCDIHIAETGAASKRQFVLHGRGQPAYGLPPHPTGEWTQPLSPEESEELHHLLSLMTVEFAPSGTFGFDGNWNTLKIVSTGIDISLRWWVTVPEGWERVGAVFDYAMELAKRTYLKSAEA